MVEGFDVMSGYTAVLSKLQAETTNAIEAIYNYCPGAIPYKLDVKKGRPAE